MFDEPDAVSTEVKGVACLMHLRRQDGEENWFPMPRSDLHGHFRFCREMDVVALHFQQPLHLNAFEEARRGAVIKDRKRFLRFVVQIYLYRMSLTGSNVRAFGTELEAFLGVGGDDVFEVGAAHGTPGLGAASKQIFHTHPACGVEGDVGRFGLMPQYHAEKFATAGGLFGAHLKSKLRDSRDLNQIRGIPSRPTRRETIPPTMAQLVSQSPSPSSVVIKAS